MKSFKLILVLLFFAPLFFCSATAQTKVDNQVETSVTIKGKTGTFELIGLENVRITPSGNFLRVVTFSSTNRIHWFKWPPRCIFFR